MFSSERENFEGVGCLAKVDIGDFRKISVRPKTFDCLFIGYAYNGAAYRFMSLPDRTICELSDAEFFKWFFL